MSDNQVKVMNSAANKFTQGRSWARRLAMQALYQWQVNHSDLDELISQFQQEETFIKADETYFIEILREVLSITDQLDALIAPHLDRAIGQLDTVERAVLWIGTYELQQRNDIPYRVVINESVELAKKFGAEGSHKFVNGVLDKVVKVVRPS